MQINEMHTFLDKKINLDCDFDFNSFWNKGGFALDLSNNTTASKVIDYATQQESYVLNYNDKYPVENAVWDTQWNVKERAPQVYLDLRDEFMNSKLFSSYYQIYKRFTFQKLMLHRTPRGYVNDYHSHTFDASHFHVFFYIAPVKREVYDGGLIEIGEVVDRENVKMDPYSFYHHSPKHHSTNISFVPYNCLALVFNNLNPYFRHRVTEVFTNKERYTFMMAFGYQENCIRTENIEHI